MYSYCKVTFIDNVWFQKMSTPTPKRVVGNSSGEWGGGLKVNIFKGNYQLKLEFPGECGKGGGGGGKAGSNRGRGMDIFSNNTM